jgi:hypothetical protein
VFISFSQYWVAQGATPARVCFELKKLACFAVFWYLALQYFGALNNYNTAISYLCREPKYRTRAMEIAKSEGLLNENKKKKRNQTKVGLWNCMVGTDGRLFSWN